jgi:endoglucanase
VNTRRFTPLLLALLCSFAARPAAAADAKPAASAPASSLLPNVGFEAATSAGKPDGWPVPAGVSYEAEGANHFLRLVSPQPGTNVNVFQAVKLPPDVRAVELRYKVRFENVRRGKQSWFDGRIMMNFKAADGSAVSPNPSHPNFKGTQADWRERVQQFRVPEGAATLETVFALFQAESGRLDFDDVSLTPIPVATIEAIEAAAAAKEAARIAALPKPKPKVAVPPADKLPKELRVAGNKLVDSAGKDVWLQGVAIPSLEWSAGGEHILESIGVAVTDWKANCIRLPIKENFWTGKGPYQKDGGMGYRQLVEDAVNLCATHGVYLVIDLHEYRAPQPKHVAFWTDVAGRYKNHPAVLFELLNEPHDISWEVWRNGGPVTDKKKAPAAAADKKAADAKAGDAGKPGEADKRGDVVVAENDQPVVAFQSVGMQKLLDAVRATGAKNIVIAGGLDWGYDLSGMLAGHALADRGGNGVVYSSHVYPWKSDWQGKFLAAAAKYPIFVGEVGAEQEKLKFLPPERQEDPYTWVPDMLAVIQQHKLNWTAWSFHPQAAPKALAGWDYTPTPYWGAFVKRALAGEKFEGKKLR